MRITDQITNHVAAETKIAVNANSLANFSSGATNNSLLDELNKSDTNQASAVTKNNYQNMQKSADELLETANRFLEEGSSSLLAVLDTEEGRSALKEQIEKLINGYNSVDAKLKTSTNALDSYYSQMLHELVSENAAGLKTLGITMSSQGKLQFDNTKIAGAETDTVKATLGSDSEFMQKLSFIAGRISDNAGANLKNLGTTYNSFGTASALSAAAGNFDFRS